MSEIVSEMHPFSRDGVVCVFRCYLDDSYDPPGTGIVTLGGYFGRTADWVKFEEAADVYLRSKEVPVLHAKEFKDSKGCFHNWTRDEKEALAVGLFDIVRECNIIGVSKSVKRSLHKSFRAVGGGAHTYSPLSMAFGALSRWVCEGNGLRLPGTLRPTHFFVESGNHNNSGIKKVFDKQSNLQQTHGMMKSLTFIPKESCRAIQIADFCAYYSRKMARELLSEKPTKEVLDGLRDEVLVAFNSVPHSIHVSYGQVTQDIKDRGGKTNVGLTRSIWIGPHVGKGS